MISTVSLWLPIIVTAVAVFIASSLIHMVFKWHNPEYRKLDNEDAVRAALRAGNPPPGQYMLPRCTDMKEMAGEPMQQKFKEGPVGMLLLRAPGLPNMGKSLSQWFALNLIIAVLCAHLAAGVLPIGAVSHRAFSLVAITSFLAYGGGSIQSGIWMGMPWRAVAKDLLDALIFGLLSGAVFAWLWPH
jgi:hypothetical protein